MRKLIITLSSAAILSACGGGGGSSSGGGSGGSTPPASDNYTQQSMVIAPSGNYTSTGSNSNGAYVATSGGFYSVSGNNTTPISGAPAGITVISGNGSDVYYVPANSSSIYSNNGTLLWDIGSGNGYITALSPSSNNGSTFYGTSNGSVGLINNPAGKVISQISNLDASSAILAIACIANGSCNSGKQGIMALTGSINGYTPFESTTYASTPSLWTYPTAFYYYNGVGNEPGWYQISNYNGSMAAQSFDTVAYYSIESNPGTMSNPPVLGTATLPEFVTAVTFNNGNIYVGTNLFNIYSVIGYTCNNGQLKNSGCPLTFTGPLNVNSNGAVAPLGWIQNGSVGITNVTVQQNGKLMVIAQESATYATVYVSNAASY